MDISPKLEYRKKVPYLAIRTEVQMTEISQKLVPLIAEVSDWLEVNNIASAGPPFFLYLKMEQNTLLVDVGFPVLASDSGSGRILSGYFPEGNYLTATYFGPYTALPRVHAALDNWGKERGINTFGQRIEFYPTDPAIEPNPQLWQTDVAVKVPDDINVEEFLGNNTFSEYGNRSV